MLFDLALVVMLVVATEMLAWSDLGPGEPIAGPQWLTATLPLLLDVPLLVRRSRPLLSWLLVIAGVALQAVVSRNSAEGLEILVPLAVGSYSVAAYGSRRNAVIGLIALLAGYSVFAWEDRGFQSGRSSELWATAFFGAMMVAAWLVGTSVNNRRDVAATAARARAAEEGARAAVASERLRLARDLHDVVAHNLSVVVLQAAGARAQAADVSTDSSGSLEKIETSAREALVEMRRMLGALRTEDESAPITPQPGIADLGSLVNGVRQAGLPVTLTTRGDLDGLPAVVGLSAYRIVQEALTNTVRHAGPARAWVVVERNGDHLDIEVTDDGNGSEAVDPPGHGLAGMRERAVLLGGDLDARPGAERGFVVRARLPVVEVGL